MNGLMLQQQLLISNLLVHAERHHGGQQIVSKRVEGGLHRYSFRDLGTCSRRMANACAALATWWTPDDVVFVNAIPLGATGKMQKNKLREMFKDYKLPTA